MDIFLTYILNFSILALVIWIVSYAFIYLTRTDKVSNAVFKTWNEKELESEVLNVVPQPLTGPVTYNRWKESLTLDFLNPEVQRYQGHLIKILQALETKDPGQHYQVVLLRTRIGIKMFFFKCALNESILDLKKVNVQLNLKSLKENCLFYLKEDPTQSGKMILEKEPEGKSWIPPKIQEDIKYIQTHTAKLPLHYRKTKYNNYYYVFDLVNMEFPCDQK